MDPLWPLYLDNTDRDRTRGADVIRHDFFMFGVYARFALMAKITMASGFYNDINRVRMLSSRSELTAGPIHRYLKASVFWPRPRMRRRFARDGRECRPILREIPSPETCFPCVARAPAGHVPW